MKSNKILTIIIMAVITIVAAIPSTAQEIVKKEYREASDTTTVLVDGRVEPIILPQRNLGRFDRGLSNYLFIPRGKWSFGITASYGELSTEDLSVLSLLDDFNFKGKIYSVKPSVGYFFKSNQSIGLQLKYSRGVADLESLSVDFDEDLSFNISDVSYYQQSMSVGAVYRNYVGLGRDGRFGIFNEVDLNFLSGTSRFKRPYDSVLKDTRTNVTQASLDFSPGVCVFIQDFVSFQVSFGVFGLKWRKENQTTDGIDEGSRFTSGANFRFNVFNINFGLMVVI